MSALTPDLRREFGQYQRRVRQRLILRTWAWSLLCFGTAALLVPKAFGTLSLGGGGLVLLGMGAFWGWRMVTPGYALRLLARQHPALAQALETALAFPAQASNAQAAYFQAKHEATVWLEFTQVAPANRLKLWPAGCVTSLSLLLLLGLAWNWHSFPQKPFGGWLSEPLALAEARAFRLLFPSYLKRPAQNFKELPPVLALPRGSRLEVYWQLPQLPLALAEESEYLTEQQTQPLQWIQREERWMAALSPSLSGTLRLTWEDSVQEHQIEVVPDLPPQVSVQWPSISPIFATSSLPLLLKASDDYGLRQILLYFQAEGRPEEYEIIQAFEGDFKEYQENYTWELSQTSLHKGQRVKAWLEVTDNDTLAGPNLTRSEKFEFTVGSVKDFHQSVLEKMYEIDQDLSELLSRLDQQLWEESSQQEQLVLKKLQDLQMQASRDGLMGEDLQSYLGELQIQLQIYQNRRQSLSHIPPS